jgi:hypothetical protein
MNWHRLFGLVLQDYFTGSPFEVDVELDYQCRRGTDRIRVILTSQIPESPHNEILHLFSVSPDRVRFGAAHFQQRSSDASALMRSLFEFYQVKGFPMPYTMEDFKRNYFREHIDEFLKEVPTEELLKRLTPEERIKGMSPEERIKGMSPDDLRTLLTKLEAKEGNNDH